MVVHLCFCVWGQAGHGCGVALASLKRSIASHAVLTLTVIDTGRSDGVAFITAISGGVSGFGHRNEAGACTISAVGTVAIRGAVLAHSAMYLLFVLSLLPGGGGGKGPRRAGDQPRMPSVFGLLRTAQRVKGSLPLG